MKDIKTIMYIVADEKNKPQFFTLHNSKSRCIMLYTKYYPVSWKFLRSQGCKCIKVNVIISSANYNQK